MVTTFLMVLLYTAMSSAWAADDPIELIYHDRPPFYIHHDDGSVTGLVAEPAARAFRNARVDFKWKLLAANRQLEIVKANRRKVCAVGWFKNAQREEFSKYTTYVYQEKPMVVINRSESHALSGYRTVDKLLADGDLKMGAKLGYSYGDFIDTMVSLHKTNMITSTQSNTGLIKMLLANRFDYIFIPGDELNSILDQNAETVRKLSVISLDDMPEGNKRYILCSKMVKDEIIDRLNAQIKENRL